MADYDVTFIPGDGIGPEVMDCARRVVEATKAKIRWDTHYMGQKALDLTGKALPEDLLESVRKNKVAIKGPHTTIPGVPSATLGLRKALQLYANVRPAKLFKGVKTPYASVDLVTIRENTEDLYSGIEFKEGSGEAKDFLKFLSGHGYSLPDDSACAVKVISRKASSRIVFFAFQFARETGRKKVTAVHKSNVLRETDGLFLQAAREAAKEFSEIQYEELHVDNMCMQLVQKPDLYDVLVLPNLYGDIVSDLCAGLVGGLGMAPAVNLGDEMAVFEPVHGSAPKYAGQNKANPIAAILCSAMMLRHLGLTVEAVAIEEAVARVVEEGRVLTRDLAGKSSCKTPSGTMEVAEAVIEKIRNILVGFRSRENG